MKSLTVPARSECVDKINAFVAEELEAYNCSYENGKNILTIQKKL